MPPSRDEIVAKLRDDWHATWHVLRLSCHQRLRNLIDLTEKEGWKPDHYQVVYGPLPERAKDSNNEGLGSFNGAFWRGFIKFLDVTLDGRELHGYNGAWEWDELLWRTRDVSAIEAAELIAKGRLKIHGGTATWSNQQRAARFYLDKNLWPVVESIVFGADGRTPDRLGDQEAIVRIDMARRRGDALGLVPPYSLCSKLFHIYDPVRWPILNTRANATMAGRLNIDVRRVGSAHRYGEYAVALRAFAHEQGLPDLDRVDILFSSLYHVSAGDEDEA